MSNQTNRAACYFCGDNGPLETHHIIPRRHGGPDHKNNLVDVCPSCHAKLERLYGDEVFEGLKAVHDTLREAEYCPACYRPVTKEMDQCIHCGVEFEKLVYDAKQPKEVVVIPRSGFDGMLQYAIDKEDSYNDAYFPTVLWDAYEETPHEWYKKLNGTEPEMSSDGVYDPQHGETQSQSDRLNTVRNTIRKMEPDWKDGVPVEEVLHTLEEEGIERSKAKQELTYLYSRGEAYEPNEETIRLT